MITCDIIVINWIGGVIGGYLYDVYGLSGIFFFTAVISVVWMMKYIITKNIGVSVVS